MSDEVVATGAESAASSATVESTPTESTVTESTNTETTSQPTETTTQDTGETGAATESFKAPTREPGEEASAYLARSIAAKAKWQEDKKNPPAKPEVKPTEAKPVEQEVKPEEAKTEEAKPAESEKVDEFAEEEGIATSELAAKLKEDPELEAKLDAAGIKNQVFANARLADKANQFLQEFPGGLEDAKFAKQGATNFAMVDDAFSGVQDPQSFNEFIQKVMPLSYILGDDGNPVLDERGQPVHDGTVGRFVENAVAYGASIYPKGVVEKLLGSDHGKEALLQELQSMGAGQDEELSAALEILTERINRGASAPSEETSAEAKRLAQERKSVEAEKQALSQQRELSKRQEVEQQDRAISTDMSNQVEGVLDSYISRYAWATEFEKNAAREEIKKLTYERIKSDPIFSSRAAASGRKAYSPAVHKERVGMAVAAFRANMAAASKVVLEKAGAKLISQQESKAKKIATQIAASKTETKGSSAIPAGKPALTESQRGAVARENLRKAGQDPYDSRLLLNEMIRLKQSGQ